jgi:hypothetical protein
MEPAELARWTPIRFGLSGASPLIDWADLSQERFVEPFFDQTVARWASSPGAAPLVQTGLDTLIALDNEPSLDPAGMIFHLSRCGSTVVSQLLGTLPGTVVLAEPSPLNALLSLHPDRVDEATLVRWVRLLVRALGRCRHGDERRLVLKCTSWNIRRQKLLTAAFPETPWAWIQRDPIHVLASVLATPPGWLGLWMTPPASARLFGLDTAPVPAKGRIDFAARALGAMLDAAAANPAGRLSIDYADLPHAVWQRVAPHFGLPADNAAIDRMIAKSRFYSKDPTPRPFDGDASERYLMTDAMRQAAERFAEPGYRALARPA